MFDSTFAVPVGASSLDTRALRVPTYVCGHHPVEPHSRRVPTYVAYVAVASISVHIVPPNLVRIVPLCVLGPLNHPPAREILERRRSRRVFSIRRRLKRLRRGSGNTPPGHACVAVMVGGAGESLAARPGVGPRSGNHRVGGCGLGLGDRHEVSVGKMPNAGRIIRDWAQWIEGDRFLEVPITSAMRCVQERWAGAIPQVGDAGGGPCIGRRHAGWTASRSVRSRECSPQRCGKRAGGECRRGAQWFGSRTYLRARS